MRIPFEEENGQMDFPVGKQEFTIEKEGYKKAEIIAYVDEESGVFDIIKRKNVEIGQKPVNILNKDGSCDRMNKVTFHLIKS